MQTRSLVIASTDGTPLFMRVHRPLSTAALRHLVIVHGAGQHGGRYQQLAECAVSRGWTVVACDLRGHGRSGGVRTHLDHFDQYLHDLEAILAAVQAQPDRTALFGHSLGGLVVTRYAQTRDQDPGALVLSSPLLALRLRVSQMKRAAGRLCALIAPRTRFKTHVREQDLTSNDQALARRRLDPLSERSVTAGWYFQVLDAVYDAWADASRLLSPVLILQGDADPIVDPEAACRWLPKVAAADKTLQLLPDQLHELMHEPGWEATVGDVLDWLDRRVQQASGGITERSADKPAIAQIRRAA